MSWPKIFYSDDMNNQKVLIVEDDDDIRELCKTILIESGFSVETCKNGKEAIAALEKHDQPCLILLDMMMPIMNGREFMVEFSKRPHTIVPIPIYLMSATATGNDGKEMGCLGFIKKPFGREALLAIVKSYCKGEHSTH